jgi:hypothetical protein
MVVGDEGCVGKDLSPLSHILWTPLREGNEAITQVLIGRVAE